MRHLLILAFLFSYSANATMFDNLSEQLARNTTLTNVSDWPSLELDIRYATHNNFTGANIYGGYQSCFLHSIAADQLKRAIASLKQSKPTWKLRVFDCLRPRRAQQFLFDAVKGTPQQKYVGNPKVGSVHNYGFAIDVSLSDEYGNEVDMGTKYDFFGALAEPRFEQGFLRSGKLKKNQLENRLILRSAMKAGGFIPIMNEWWHFNGLPGPDVRSKYKIVE